MSEEKNGCVHPEDEWTNYGCGDCGDYRYNCGCRGPKGNTMIHKQVKGEWIVTERGCVITCSNCKERVELYYPDGTQTGPLPYCPYCGSKNKEV